MHSFVTPAVAVGVDSKLEQGGRGLLRTSVSAYELGEEASKITVIHDAMCMLFPFLAIDAMLRREQHAHGHFLAIDAR